MIDSRRQIDRTRDVKETTKVATFNPDDYVKNKDLTDVAAVSGNSLRPPELQFSDDTRLGTPRFAKQAIASMDMLKANPQETTMNNLSMLLMEHGGEIEEYGTPDARNGLRVLDEFLGLNAMLIAMNNGPAS